MRAVITRLECKAKDNLKDLSKLRETFTLQKSFNHFLCGAEIIAIKLLRTDTTLDLSQKAEKV